MPARILIIEDDETSLALMVYLFHAFGYTPVVARDGGEGLEAAHSVRPELIVCDLALPGLHGYEVGRRLKHDPDLRNVPLVAVTALVMVGEREKVLAAGFDGYIPKPIVPETFIGEVEAFLPPAVRSNRSPEAASGAPPSRQAPRPPKRATVLVVDDSAVNLFLIRSILEPSGYEIITSRRPDEALKLAQRTSPDLILSDVHMPGQSGFEFGRTLKDDPRLGQIPLILVSCSIAAQAVPPSWAAALPGVKVILGPLEPETLLNEVEASLQKAVRRSRGDDFDR